MHLLQASEAEWGYIYFIYCVVVYKILKKYQTKDYKLEEKTSIIKYN